MNVNRFIKEMATPAHEGTILASNFLPKNIEAPFGSAWGYLDPQQEMVMDSHPTHEVYVIIKGLGNMTVGDETRVVGPGDVIDIPSHANHRLTTVGMTEPLLWAALWW